MGTRDFRREKLVRKQEEISMTTKSAAAKKRDRDSVGLANDQIPSMAGLSGRVGYQLRRAHSKSNELFIELLSGKGIAPGQYGVLKIISLNPARSQKEIAAIAGIDATTLVPTVEYLERQGWIDRQRHSADRRHVVLSTTPAGERLLKKLEVLIEMHEERLTRQLSPEDRETLVRLLAVISEVEAE